MNIIRTKAVELSTISAIAYKQKLASGGAGIKIIRVDGQSAVCTVDKRTTDLIPYSNFNEDFFPMEAFDEAVELTNSLPYSARGNIKLLAVEDVQPEDVSEQAPAEQVDMTLSPEYKAIVDRYSDEKGKLNYTLMNKDFIQFASKRKIVAAMVDASTGTDEILEAIIKSRTTEISGQKESLDDNNIRLLIETLDEIDPRSAFKELKSYIVRMLSKNKKR